MAIGNKGKFSERLKRIALMKRKRKSNDEVILNEYKGTDNSNVSSSGNGIKRFLLIPLMFMEGLFVKNDDKNLIQKKESVIKKSDTKVEESILIENSHNSKKKLPSVALRKRSVRLTNTFGRNVSQKKELTNVNQNKEISPFVKKEQDEKNVEELEKEIIKLIKKRLINLCNEYEILCSDFYVLKELLKEDFYYERCMQNVKETKRLLSKINALKEKYDYLKENVDFDNLLELDDDLLEDKIIELRNQLDSNNLSYIVKDYKLLKEYQSLYFKIDKLQKDTVVYEDERIKRCELLKKNNIDFEAFKMSLFNYSTVNNGYKLFVEKQNQYLKSLNDKINVIDSYEDVQYSFKGIGALISNSFKYIGLLMLSPLKGIIPGIATHAVISKNIIENLKQSMSIEEKRTIIYKAIDYSDEINRVINNVDDMSRMIDDSLIDIAALKKKYNDNFKKYEGNYREYQDAIKKLNKIENSIIGNRVKLDIMRKRMSANKRINEEKMVKVKRLNQHD